MKRPLTLAITAIFMLATFVSCNNDDEYTAETPGTPDVSVTGVSLNPTTASLIVGGETVTLVATILPENATNQNVTWSSNNASVATVSNSGVVTGVSEGTATITATTQDGEFTATSTVTVTQQQPLPTGCNGNTPGWGASLGAITWGNVTNTNINSGTTTITGTGGRPNQIWSGAVFATACNKGNTTNSDAFDGGVAGSFNADCRQSLHTFNAGIANGITGDFFSWCAVMRFADQLCPSPWRVPTTEDIAILHQNLGHSLPILGQASWLIANTYMGEVGTVEAPQIGGSWGGVRFTGHANNLTIATSYYWTSTEVSATDARLLGIGEVSATPQIGFGKNSGFTVRCVRN